MKMIHVLICVDGAFFFSSPSAKDVIWIMFRILFFYFDFVSFVFSRLLSSLFGSYFCVLFFSHYYVAYCYVHNVEASS